MPEEMTLVLHQLARNCSVKEKEKKKLLLLMKSFADERLHVQHESAELCPNSIISVMCRSQLENIRWTINDALHTHTRL